MWVIEASKAFGGDFVPACHPWEILKSQLFASSDPEKTWFLWAMWIWKVSRRTIDHSRNAFQLPKWTSLCTVPKFDSGLTCVSNATILSTTDVVTIVTDPYWSYWLLLFVCVSYQQQQVGLFQFLWDFEFSKSAQNVFLRIPTYPMLSGGHSSTCSIPGHTVFVYWCSYKVPPKTLN